MLKLPFTQVDAFAGRAFEGNPAAVIPLDAWLPDETLIAIAAENNLSETGFTVPTSGDADYELRWFTPTTEVALCGHATLASGHVMLSGDPERERVRFRTRNAGLLEVAREGEAYRMSLPAWKPAPRPLPDMVAALGVEAVETLWHPQRYGLVIVADEDAVRAAQPDMAALAAGGDLLAIVSAPGRDTDIVSRVFAPGAGVPEDPVTGSAHAVMVPYWVERLGCETMTAYQASARGGRLGCRYEPSLGEGRVVLTGSCVTVIEGSFFIDA